MHHRVIVGYYSVDGFGVSIVSLGDVRRRVTVIVVFTTVRLVIFAVSYNTNIDGSQHKTVHFLTKLIQILIPGAI